MIKMKEIQSYSKEELLQTLEKNKKELFNLKLKNSLGQLENTASIANTKKNIVRLKTQLSLLKSKKNT